MSLEMKTAHPFNVRMCNTRKVNTSTCMGTDCKAKLKLACSCVKTHLNSLAINFHLWFASDDASCKVLGARIGGVL